MKTLSMHACASVAGGEEGPEKYIGGIVDFKNYLLNLVEDGQGFIRPAGGFAIGTGVVTAPAWVPVAIVVGVGTIVGVGGYQAVYGESGPGKVDFSDVPFGSY